MSPVRNRVEQRWGYAFWEVVRDFAEQGLSRSKVSRALGVNYNHFNVLLIANPKHDPFPPSNKQLAYVQDTGEPFREAVERLQREGVRVRAAAWQLGFADASAFRRHLEGRGLGHYFQKRDPIADYCAAHSVTLDQALQQLRAEGVCKTRAFKILGLSAHYQLAALLKREGYPADFFSMTG